MLIIPTSLDTAVVVEIAQPLIWMAVTSTLLTVGVYCLWEMLASLVTRQPPSMTRWAWLAASIAVLAAAAFSSGTMFGPVTFNADGADWVRTSWGGVIGSFLMATFGLCVLVVLALRSADTVHAARSGRPLGAGLRLIGLGTAVAYGILLALNADGLYGSALETPVRALGFALGVSGVGSLLAALVIRRIRLRRTGAARSASI